jgi:alkanesulfonate monooxygenase
MKVSVHALSFTWPGGPQRLAQDLTRVAQAAEDNGFDKLSVMDHLWQIVHNGPDAPRPALPRSRRLEPGVR